MMTQKEQEAYDAGYEAGWKDEGEKCPYPEDSDEELFWYGGHSDALDGYSKSFGM